MDIEEPSGWAKSTESKIQNFFDNYLISSTIPGVRNSMQTLLFSLYKKGNTSQRLTILKLILHHCNNLTWMGKASHNFLGLIKKIFGWSSKICDHQVEIIDTIFNNLETINQNMVKNPNYQFYSFASNVIDFGNKQFKPYLLEANGCLNCFGCVQDKAEFLTKLDSFVDIHKVFTNRMEYAFKRYYQISDLSIILKTTNKFKALSVSYLDLNKEYKFLKKYRPGENILIKDVIQASGLLFQFQMPITKRDSIQCIFCGNLQEINCVCPNCPRKNDKVQISGKFKTVGADSEKISKQLCSDYQKIKDSINKIKTLYVKIESKQKINFNFALDEMYQTYQKIINNLKLLNQQNQEKFTGHSQKNCFSCNFYQVSNIVNFLKEIASDAQNYSFSPEQIKRYKQTLTNCLQTNSIQTIKLDLTETLSKFYLLSDNTQIEDAQILISILRCIKEKKNVDNSIQKIFKNVLTNQKLIQKFTKQERIKLFVNYFADSDFLTQIQSLNHTVETKRISENEAKSVYPLIAFDISQIFNLNIDCYLRAFLKMLPVSLLPEINLDLTDTEFLYYLKNKIPQIDETKIEKNIIKSTRQMIKLDMFNCLPTLIQQLTIQQSMPLMNKLFKYRSVWNLNIIQACEYYGQKICELSPEDQIYLCLNGYHASQQYLYIERIHKLLVPQRLNFIIRLDPPIDQIQRMSFQYPYIPIRQVRSQELKTNTIQGLHDWVYAQLQKINQAMPLDIIVQKSIIDNMDLPIEVVFQKIVEHTSKKTIGTKVYDFFRVIYRIQGILGQPKQRSIGNPRDEKLETCIALSSHFLNKFSQSQKKIGLDVLIQILEQIKLGSQSQQKKMLLFEILSTLSLNEALCKKIVEGEYGDSIINATVRLMSFQNERDAKITNFLLELSSKVIDEANQQMINLRKGSTNQMRKLSGFDMDIQASSSDNQNKVRYVLEKFQECENSYEKSGNVLYRDIARRLVKLLPFCSKDQLQSSKNLFNFFEFANWSTKSSSKMQILLIFMETLSESYMTFKQICRDNGITDQILKTVIENVRKQGETVVDQAKLSNNRSIVESALLLLCSLVQGDEQLQQRMFDEKIFHNIYDISLIGPKKTVEIKAGKVPENCYKIVKYFSQGKIVDQRIADFIKNKRQEEKNVNKPKKNKKWEQIKNKQKNIMLSKNVSEEEKDFIVCSTCQEGYSKRKDVLGFYIYFTKNQIPPMQNWWKDTRKIGSYTSTTFFTAIHYDCHMKAYEADQKIPLAEWDGALIRNMDVLCNGWIPFKGPKTTNDQLSRVDRKYFERNKGGCYWNIINDLKSLLHKLSIEFDFAKESKGSSYTHNIRYIPILIGFASYMIEKNNGADNIDEGIKYFFANIPTKIHNYLLFLTVGIFSLTYKQFLEQKGNLMKLILNTFKEGANEEQWFQEHKKQLIYLKIIEQIFINFHSVLKDDKEKKVHILLEEHLQSQTQTIIKNFEQMGEEYKNSYTKFTNAGQYNL